MRRQEFIAGLSGTAATWPLAAHGQQTGRLRRIGALMDVTETYARAKIWREAFESELVAAGWRRGGNYEIEYRWGGSKPELLAQYAEELVRSAPDVFLAHGSPALIPLKKTNTTIPIVFTSVTDPVAQGFVAGLSHPGGNVTGFSNFEPSIGGKWLQILKEIAPSVTNIAVMFNPRTAPYYTLFLRSIDSATPIFAMSAVQTPVLSEEDIRKAVALLATKSGSGLVVLPDPFTSQYAAVIVSLAMSNRVPAIYGIPQFAQEGGLVVYGIDPDEQLRKAAGYVDRILKGEKPDDLPIQQPTKFDLLVNLKTAKALGLNVPAAIVATADEVIE
jgi:putative tryptophan/tyrosine transport system substrate-binding protein